MARWLWRHLPGSAPWRVAQVALLIAAAVAGLFGWVFPWVEAEVVGLDPAISGT